MKLQRLLIRECLAGPDLPAIWARDPEISGLAFDSRRVRQNGLFFAIKGFVTDGKKFLKDAFAKGAAAAAVDSLEGVPAEFADRCVPVRDPRRELARASAEFFGHPTRELVLYGVTGTNGKTSCAYILAAILRAAGHSVALMGTVARSYPGRSEAAEHTTQESLEIQQFLREARGAGATAAVIEVSSHALSLDRVADCEFDACLFTNLEPDHQDFYKGMEPYYEAKRKLFLGYNGPASRKRCIGAANADDPYGVRLLREARVPMVSFGIGMADYRWHGLRADADAIRGAIELASGRKIAVESRLAPTRFNLANVAACVALAHAAGLPEAAIVAGIRDMDGVPGRLTRVQTTLGFAVYVDFAHSGPKLRSVLTALKEICRGKLIAVFGAGGDKDPLRRTTMGEAAADLADATFVTTDNPRSEDPQQIIAAIVAAWKARAERNGRAGTLVVEADRAQAIRQALASARAGDIVCIAGKGHEQGQIVKDKVFPFDDGQTAAQILRELELCSR